MLALITGASSGLGIEFARLLAINGYDLIISARRKDRLESLKKVLEKKYKINVEVVPADLSKVSEVERLAESCFNREVDIFEAWRVRLFIRKRNILNMDHSLTPSILTMHIPAKIPVTRIKSATSCRLKPISVIQVCVPGLSSPLHNAAAASSSLMFKIEIKRGINIYVIVSDGLNKRLRALHSMPRIRIAD